MRRLPGPVERGGTIPPGQEGRGSTLGTLSSVGRRLLAIAHFRNRDRFDAGESSSSGAGQWEVGAEHDADAGRDRGDQGTSSQPRPWTAGNGFARAETHC